MSEEALKLLLCALARNERLIQSQEYTMVRLEEEVRNLEQKNQDLEDSLKQLKEEFSIP